jgi:hypothetical protein
MLQMTSGQGGPFRIKSIRKVADAAGTPNGSTCSLEPGDGTDKPPC